MGIVEGFSSDWYCDVCGENGAFDSYNKRDAHKKARECGFRKHRNRPSPDESGPFVTCSDECRSKMAEREAENE